MQQLARITLIKGWGSLLLQELCNLRELGIKTGFVLMMCWCLQGNRVFSQLWREASLRKVLSTKLCSLLPNHPQPQNQKGLECRDMKMCKCASRFFSFPAHPDTLHAQQGGSRSGMCLGHVQEQLEVAPSVNLLNRLFLVRWSLGNSST